MPTAARMSILDYVGSPTGGIAQTGRTLEHRVEHRSEIAG
jgi:hypothetical protein